MSKKKGDEEIYTLTFKGLLTQYTGWDKKAVENILDGLELYLRRNFMDTPGECGAIIYTGKEWVITSVQKDGGSNG